MRFVMKTRVTGFSGATTKFY